MEKSFEFKKCGVFRLTVSNGRTDDNISTPGGNCDGSGDCNRGQPIETWRSVAGLIPRRAFSLSVGTNSNVAMNYGMMIGIVRAPAVIAIGLLCWGHPCDPGALRAADKDDAVVASLQSALSKNTGHARNWLDQADYKSLNQSAGGLQLLAATTEGSQRRRGVAGGVRRRSKRPSATCRPPPRARTKPSARRQSTRLEKSAAALVNLKPTGKPLSPPRAPAIRPLMLIMDGLYADAKIALLSGNVEAAKKQAIVLAELGGLVSNSRQTDQWTSHRCRIHAARPLPPRSSD